MADVVIDGYIRVSSVPTIANLAAPTTAELNAGVAYEMLLTQDGLNGFASTTNWVNNSALGSTFDTQLPGTVPAFAFFTNLPQYIKDSYTRFLDRLCSFCKRDAVVVVITSHDSDCWRVCDSTRAGECCSITTKTQHRFLRQKRSID